MQGCRLSDDFVRFYFSEKTTGGVLGPGDEICTGRLVCCLITVFYEEAIEVIYNVLETSRLKLMSLNCKCLVC